MPGVESAGKYSTVGSLLQLVLQYLINDNIEPLPAPIPSSAAIFDMMDQFIRHYLDNIIKEKNFYRWNLQYIQHHELIIDLDEILDYLKTLNNEQDALLNINSIIKIILETGWEHIGIYNNIELTLMYKQGKEISAVQEMLKTIYPALSAIPFITKCDVVHTLLDNISTRYFNDIINRNAYLYNQANLGLIKSTEAKQRPGEEIDWWRHAGKTWFFDISLDDVQNQLINYYKFYAVDLHRSGFHLLCSERSKNNCIFHAGIDFFKACLNIALEQAKALPVGAFPYQTFVVNRHPYADIEHNKILVLDENSQAERYVFETIVMIKKKKELSAYWLSESFSNANNKHSQSFPISEVNDILGELPLANEGSTDFNLIRRITAKYQCKTPSIIKREHTLITHEHVSLLIDRIHQGLPFRFIQLMTVSERSHKFFSEIQNLLKIQSYYLEELTLEALDEKPLFNETQLKTLIQCAKEHKTTIFINNPASKTQDNSQQKLFLELEDQVSRNRHQVVLMPPEEDKQVPAVPKIIREKRYPVYHLQCQQKQQVNEQVQEQVQEQIQTQKRKQNTIIGEIDRAHCLNLFDLNNEHIRRKLEKSNIDPHHFWYAILREPLVRHSSVTHITPEAVKEILRTPTDYLDGPHIDEDDNEDDSDGFFLKYLADHTEDKQTESPKQRQLVLCFDRMRIKKSAIKSNKIQNKSILRGTGWQFVLDEKTLKERNPQTPSPLDLPLREFKSLNDEQSRAYFTSYLTANHAELATQISQASLFKTWKAKHFQALLPLFIRDRAQGVMDFMQLLNQVPHEHWNSFQLAFLDRTDWSSFLTEENKHAFPLLNQFSPIQWHWWNQLTIESTAYLSSINFAYLLNKFKNFVKQYCEMTGDSDIPKDCPLKNVKNMRIMLDRLLIILGSSANPKEQARHLKELDFSFQGAMTALCFNGFLQVTSEMQLSPSYGIQDNYVVTEDQLLEYEYLHLGKLEVYFYRALGRQALSSDMEMYHDFVAQINKTFLDGYQYLNKILLLLVALSSAGKQWKPNSKESFDMLLQLFTTNVGKLQHSPIFDIYQLKKYKKHHCSLNIALSDWLEIIQSICSGSLKFEWELEAHLEELKKQSARHTVQSETKPDNSFLTAQGSNTFSNHQGQVIVSNNTPLDQACYQYLFRPGVHEKNSFLLESFLKNIKTIYEKNSKQEFSNCLIKFLNLPYSPNQLRIILDNLLKIQDTSLEKLFPLSLLQHLCLLSETHAVGDYDKIEPLIIHILDREHFTKKEKKALLTFVFKNQTLDRNELTCIIADCYSLKQRRFEDFIFVYSNHSGPHFTSTKQNSSLLLTWLSTLLGLSTADSEHQKEQKNLDSIADNSDKIKKVKDIIRGFLQKFSKTSSYYNEVLEAIFQPNADNNVAYHHEKILCLLEIIATWGPQTELSEIIKKLHFVDLTTLKTIKKLVHLEFLTFEKILKCDDFSSQLNDLLIEVQINPFPQKKRDFSIKEEDLLRLVSDIDHFSRGFPEILPPEVQQEFQDSIDHINKIGYQQGVLTREGHSIPVKDLLQDEIEALVSSCKTVLRDTNLSEVDKQEKKLLLLALAREMCYRTTGKFLNIAQLLSTLTIWSYDQHSVLSRILSGEGKTLTIGVTHLLHCLQGKSIRILTQNDPLAIDGFKETYRFLKALGVSSTCITHESEYQDYCQEGFNYADLGNTISFFEKMEWRGIFITNVVTVLDEGDFLLRDIFALLYRQAYNRLCRSWNTVYPSIIAFIDKLELNFQKNDIVKEVDLHLLRKYLLSQHTSLAAEDLPETLLRDWLNDAITSKFLVETEDYLIQTDERIIDEETFPISIAGILDKNRGRVSEKSAYQNYVHPLLHCRLNQYAKQRQIPLFPIDPVTRSQFSLSAESFIRGSEHLFAYSGTWETDPQTILSLLNLSERPGLMFYFPPYHVNKLTIDPPIIAENDEQAYSHIKSTIKMHLAKKESILLFANSIHTGTTLYNQLKQDFKSPIQWINANTITQENKENKTTLETEQQATQQAGQECMLNITTSMLARGANIPSKKLHVISTDPDNARNLIQEFYRACRYGNPGSAGLITTQTRLKNTSSKETSVRIQEHQRAVAYFDDFGRKLYQQGNTISTFFSRLVKQINTACIHAINTSGSPLKTCLLQLYDQWADYLSLLEREWVDALAEEMCIPKTGEPGEEKAFESRLKQSTQVFIQKTLPEWKKLVDTCQQNLEKNHYTLIEENKKINIKKSEEIKESDIQLPPSRICLYPTIDAIESSLIVSLSSAHFPKNWCSRERLNKVKASVLGFENKLQKIQADAESAETRAKIAVDTTRQISERYKAALAQAELAKAAEQKAETSLARAKTAERNALANLARMEEARKQQQKDWLISLLLDEAVQAAIQEILDTLDTRSAPEIMKAREQISWLIILNNGTYQKTQRKMMFAGIVFALNVASLLLATVVPPAALIIGSSAAIGLVTFFGAALLGGAGTGAGITAIAASYHSYRFGLFQEPPALNHPKAPCFETIGRVNNRAN